MTNINVRVIGTANMSQMSSGFAAVEAQVAATNAQLEKMIALQKGVDPRGFERMSRAAADNAKNVRNAAASTGLFHTEQLRLNSAEDDYIKKLKARKLSFRDMRKAQATAQSAFRSQLAQQNMMLRQNTQAISSGRKMVDTFTPTAVSAEAARAGTRLAFMNEQMKSGAHQMVNWGKNTQWAGRQLMVGLTMPVLAFGAAAGVMSYQVDKELTRVAKVYDTTANAASNSLSDQMAVEKELQDLREAGTATAIKSAREYGAAATDTLNVQAELAATGQKGAELQKSTAEVMRISRLGELENADAIKTTIALQSVFRMSSEKLTETFNYMNSVENATSLATKDFAAAIPIAAAPIKQFGGDIQELGTLLTAMKERGIEATQGANAIKAAMQRLGRPSKQIQEEFTAMTGADITKIFDQSKSLTEIFTAINDVTKDLSRQDKTKVFAGLFGSYQVTRMSALVEGMQDLEDGVGQVTTAQNLASQSTKSWADTAEREITRYRESLSGQWDTAFQEMKVQLATMGEPFVKAATVVVKGISWIIKGFNALPDFAKWGIGLGVAGAAAAGALLMIAGLLGNLVGSSLKAIAGITGLFVKMEILTTESRAAALAAKLQTEGYITQTKAVQNLTIATEAMARAQAEANAMTAARYPSAAPGVSPARGPVGGTAAQMPAVMGTPWQNFGNYAVDSEKAAKANQKSASAMQKGAVSAGILGVAMAAQLATQNKMVDAMAQWAMIVAIAVPAVGALRDGMKAVWAWTVATSKTLKGNFLTALAASGSKMAGLRAAMAAFVTPMGLAVAAVAAVGVGIWKWYDHLRDIREEQTRLTQSVNKLADTWAESAGKAKKEWGGVVIAMQDALKMSKQQKLYDEYTTGDLAGEAKDFGTLSSDDQKLRAQEHFMELQVKYGLSAKEAAGHVRALMAAGGEGLAEQEAMVKTLLGDIGEIKQENIGDYLANQFTIAQGTQNKTEHIAGFSMEDQLTPEYVTAGKNAAEAFVMGFNDAATPQQAKQLLDQFAKGATAEWNNVSAGIFDAGPVKDALKKMGIEGADELRKAVREAGGPEQFLQDPELAKLGGGLTEFKLSLQAADKSERMFFGAVSKSAEALGFQMDDNIDTLDEFVNHWLIASQTMNFKQAQQEVKDLRKEMLLNADVGGMGDQLNATAEFFGGKVTSDAKEMRDMLFAMGKAGGEAEDKANEFAAAMATIAKMHGIKEGKDAVQTYFNILHNVKAETDRVTEATKNWARAVSFSKEELNSIQHDAMAGVQQDIADDIRSSFDNRMQGALDARQAMWDRRAEALDNEMQRRSDAMDAMHERQQDALDHKWDIRMDHAEAYWDKRVESVERAIDVEEKAEAKRQKMFENEINRINKLNEAMNRNIDFNVALNEGNFDEAAKIRNDATANAAQTALERAQAAGAGQSARRVDKLEGRRDYIEKARDKAMDALDQQMEHEKKMLEKSQARQKKHLEKVTEMRQNALEQQTEDDMAAQQEIWESRKESLEDQLALFLAFTAKNQKQLRQHMKNVGIEYNDFERNVIKPKATTWGKYFGESLHKHMRESGLALSSDKMWETLGNRSRDAILKGMGFDNMAQFRKFIETGKLPGGKDPAPGAGTTGEGAGRHPGGASTRHEGGPVGGKGKDSRKGVARTLKGLHPNEAMIRAQKGEFIVNKDAAAANEDILHHINSGRALDYGRPHNDTGASGTGGAGPLAGAAAMVSGLTAAMFMAGAKAALNRKNDEKMAEVARAQSAAGGVKTTGKAGVYGGRFFGAEQMKNATTIANVGAGMNMSTRDIEIGIMTAITESGLVNIHGGDRDSQGLFQQRPSMGWGTVAQVTDPSYAAHKFFSVLKSIGNRANMSPWMAAQSVQRSAYSDGSNYAPYWDDARGIYNAMGTKGGGGGGGQVVPGAGGRHRPVSGTLTQGIHDSYTGYPAVDIGTSVGHPVYAAADGKVTRSYDLVGNDGRVSNGGYYSYGRVIYMDHGGFETLYAHLSSRFARAGQQVSGGSVIGKSGNTGHSFGPHLHFGAKGISPYAFLEKGTSEVRWDNTIANLHHGEAVLTKDLNEKFHRGVDNFAKGPSIQYNGDMYFELPPGVTDVKGVAREVVKILDRQDDRKPGSRKR